MQWYSKTRNKIILLAPTLIFYLIYIVRFACCAASLSTQNHGGLTSLLPEKQVVECVESNYPYNTL